MSNVKYERTIISKLTFCLHLRGGRVLSESIFSAVGLGFLSTSYAYVTATRRALEKSASNTAYGPSTVSIPIVVIDTSRVNTAIVKIQKIGVRGIVYSARPIAATGIIIFKYIIVGYKAGLHKP